jgi:diadenosine tetraphosphate (Ap4A) HIT family hydrolase
MSFTLHPNFASTTNLGHLPICRVLLNSNFSQFPWLILVPRRTGCRDLTDLPDLDYQPVMEEVRQVHNLLRSLTGADKMNVAAIGNVTSQLHIHVIARFTTDACWPKPVWDHSSPQPSPSNAFAQQVLQALTAANIGFTPLLA